VGGADGEDEGGAAVAGVARIVGAVADNVVAGVADFGFTAAEVCFDVAVGGVADAEVSATHVGGVFVKTNGVVTAGDAFVFAGSCDAVHFFFSLLGLYIHNI
jgi:hypothetical protein